MKLNNIFHSIKNFNFNTYKDFYIKKDIIQNLYLNTDIYFNEKNFTSNFNKLISAYLNNNFDKFIFKSNDYDCNKLPELLRYIDI